MEGIKDTAIPFDLEDAECNLKLKNEINEKSYELHHSLFVIAMNLNIVRVLEENKILKEDPELPMGFIIPTFLDSQPRFFWLNQSGSFFEEDFERVDIDIPNFTRKPKKKLPDRIKQEGLLLKNKN